MSEIDAKLSYTAKASGNHLLPILGEPADN
jgi:hypothetical protein